MVDIDPSPYIAAPLVPYVAAVKSISWLARVQVMYVRLSVWSQQPGKNKVPRCGGERWGAAQITADHQQRVGVN